MVGFKDKLQATLRGTKIYPRLLRIKRAAYRVKQTGRRRATGRPDRFCLVPWTESCILSDGTVVCGCYDGLALVPLGDVNRKPFAEVWNGRRYRSLRRKMIHGHETMYLCAECPFALERNVAARDAGGFSDRSESFPRRLHIEPTVRCNLRCLACGRDMAARSRRRPDMPFELFEKVIKETGPHLSHLNLYDYGESFLHPRIFDMIRLAKQVNPDLNVIVSTNGIPLHTEQRRNELISSGCDEVIFSVDGASAETYSRYRVGGDFDRVIANMRELVAERNRRGTDVPRVVWRYILFVWNDSDDEMNRARALAKDIGVDWFCWMTTSTPQDGYSRRFAPGTADYESIRNEMFPSLDSEQFR